MVVVMATSSKDWDRLGMTVVDDITKLSPARQAVFRRMRDELTTERRAELRRLSAS